MEFNNQTEYWDGVSKNKEFTTPLDIGLISRYAAPGSLIVDYGCGYGRTLNELYNNGFKNSIGLDISEGMIKRGKQEHPHLNLKVCTSVSIDCNAGSVDLVILFAVLTCIIDNRKQEDLINEIWRVLKPGGLIYINDFLLNSDKRNTNRYKKFAVKHGVYGAFELPEGAVLRHHDQRWIESLTARFQKEEYYKTRFKTMNGNISSGFVFIGRKN